MRRLKALYMVCLSGFLAIGLIIFTGRAQEPGENGAVAPYREAPTGFDNQTNGFVEQTIFAADRRSFEAIENITDGLGPIYNAQSCRECHQSPVTGGISQIREFRAGHLDKQGNFVGATVVLRDELGRPVTIADRSLINLRAICPGVDLTQVVDGRPFSFPNSFAQETVGDNETIRTPRTSLNVLGDGFVESVADATLLALARNQCDRTGGEICGQALMVPVVELPGAMAVGRFGWKDQVASLLTFSGDAYLNEMGITSRLFPNEVTTLCDIVPDPEDRPGPDGLDDVDHFARFMRATKAPARDALLSHTPDARAGEQIFHRIGCATCHVSTIRTAPPGTAVAGGAFIVPPALGNKIIHPFSDFLLHNIGTGDGIVQNGGQETAEKLRTSPLWGVRLRPEMMHDGLSLTFESAIVRHAGEAARVTNRFRELDENERRRLIAFLKSL